MTDRRETRPLIARHWPLWENDYAFAECVTADGEAAFWLMAPPCPCGEFHDELREHGRAGPDYAPHDQDGPLPYEYLERIELVLSRTETRDDDVPRLPQCGRPTAARRPCRQIVREEGDACRLHLGQPALKDDPDA